MIKQSVLYIIGIVVLVSVFGFIMVREDSNSNSLVSNSVSGEAQEIVLSVKDYNYYPNTVKIQVNKPVKISLDSSVSGCLRDFTIRDFGIRKYLKTPQDFVEFTPTKKGTYAFACSMNMGTGTLVVE